MHSSDLCALGAATLPTRDLVGILLPRLDDEELRAAERALALVGPPRLAALRSHRAGAQLLAAVELGRRAWMLPSPAGRRIRSAVDVAAVVAPRAEADDGDALWVLALDVRLTLARLEHVRADPGEVLRCTVGAASSRLVVAQRRASRAVPDGRDEDLAERIQRGCAFLGVKLVDFVILGDDGFCSLVRLGLVPSTEPRYR